MFVVDFWKRDMRTYRRTPFTYTAGRSRRGWYHDECVQKRGYRSRSGTEFFLSRSWCLCCRNKYSNYCYCYDTSIRQLYVRNVKKHLPLSMNQHFNCCSASFASSRRSASFASLLHCNTGVKKFVWVTIFKIRTTMATSNTLDMVLQLFACHVRALLHPGTR